MKYQKGTFLLTPNKNHFRGERPPVQVVFIWLNDHANMSGKCYPSLSKLSKDCGLSTRHIRRAIQRLETLKLVSKKMRGNKGRSNLYQINILLDKVNGDNMSGGADNMSSSERTICPPNSIHRTTGTNVASKARGKNNMSFKEYNESQHQDDVPTVDAESGDYRETPPIRAKTEVYKRLVSWAESERGFKFLPNAITKQYKAFSIASKAKLTAADLKRRWIEMSEDKFWSQKGFDWMDVVNSFNKKPK